MKSEEYIILRSAVDLSVRNLVDEDVRSQEAVRRMEYPSDPFGYVLLMQKFSDGAKSLKNEVTILENSGIYRYTGRLWGFKLGYYSVWADVGLSKQKGIDDMVWDFTLDRKIISYRSRETDEAASDWYRNSIKKEGMSKGIILTDVLLDSVFDPLAEELPNLIERFL
ncbi:hypothetical protein COV93_07380 [Candidatus Woesearchaeota archaeon CG11_big_fil_rev_8_21_14_0_20_43_8]|nr:MAG: hypothetical protein COV93_07380 [Candidatus Woesearchaeota archaeon CG11_big_fil_rev_8_21_14_0_20_43_8]PIO04532.1 MAG: hypothetical protein COT47_08585 [Candidatus Woesearchaeota archaeon CG08_land_8_20_14_0_20_43_7]